MAEQSPEQHSPAVRQMSPVGWQPATGMHVPFAAPGDAPWQFVEQHSAPRAQFSPKILQAPPGSGAHVWFVQMPEQQSVASAHPRPSGLHVVPPQIEPAACFPVASAVPTQSCVQQSRSYSHSRVTARQSGDWTVHLFVAALHTVEQHWSAVALVQDAPLSRQGGLPGGTAHFSEAGSQYPDWHCEWSVHGEPFGPGLFTRQT